MFRELCGESALGNVVLVTNMWKEDSQDTNEARERELSTIFFKQAVDKGAHMVRHLNTAESAHNIVRRIMGNRPVALRIQRQLVDERKGIADTAAGRAINQELGEQMRQHEAELKRVLDDVMQAAAEKDEVTREELEEETMRLQDQMEKIKKDWEGMTAGYAMEKRRVEARMIAMEQRGKDRGGRGRT